MYCFTMSDSSESRPSLQVGGAQHIHMLADVLHELTRTNVPFIEHTTRVAKTNYSYYLEELIPSITKRRVRKDSQNFWGRIAVCLHAGFSPSPGFTVYQPNWLVPLEEEVAAISTLLPELPEITTNYVVASRESNFSDTIKTMGLVPEVKMELSDARIQYWTAKVDMIAAEARQQLEP